MEANPVGGTEMHEDPTPYRFTPMTQPSQESHALVPVLERIAIALEKLVQIEEKKNSSP